MKFPISLMVLIAITGSAAAGFAGGPDAGFFAGVAGSAQWISGKGTWDTSDFNVDQPLTNEDGVTVGLMWPNHMIIGAKPVFGYKINPGFALQFGYTLNIPKSSSESYSGYSGNVTYEQGYSAEWAQSSFDLVGLYYPDEDLGYYFYGGVELVRAEVKITLFESAQGTDQMGDLFTNSDNDLHADHTSTAGFVVGAGWEIPAESNKRVTFITLQYSHSVTNDNLFGTEDFKVNVGGISFMAGIKWFHFTE